MSKLIFNPEKDIKELEKYGFEYDCDIEEYVISINSLKTRGVFGRWVRIGYLFYDCTNNKFYDYMDNNYFGIEKEYQERLNQIYDDLKKANLIIDEEELNETNGATNN